MEMQIIYIIYIMVTNHYFLIYLHSFIWKVSFFIYIFFESHIPLLFILYLTNWSQ